MLQTPPAVPTPGHHPHSSESVTTLQNIHHYTAHHQAPYTDGTQFSALPEFTPDLTIPGWTAPHQVPMSFAQAPMQPLDAFAGQTFDPNNPAYPFPGTYDATGQAEQEYVPQYWDMDTGVFGNGLNQMQQEELMHSLETDGMEDIQSIISHTLASITPKQTQNPTF